MPTVDADVLAHPGRAPGTAGFEAVVTRFGRDVLHPHGEIDRGRLGQIVFADDRSRAISRRSSIRRSTRRSATGSRRRGGRPFAWPLPTFPALRDRSSTRLRPRHRRRLPAGGADDALMARNDCRKRTRGANRESDADRREDATRRLRHRHLGKPGGHGRAGRDVWNAMSSSFADDARAVRVFLSSMAIVSGPTPPGTGVGPPPRGQPRDARPPRPLILSVEIRRAALSGPKRRTAWSRSVTRLMPTSTTVAPGFTNSASRSPSGRWRRRGCRRALTPLEDPASSSDRSSPSHRAAEQQRHGFANDLAPADDDGVPPGGGDLLALEQRHDA